MSAELLSRLASGLAEMQLSVSTEQQQQLIDYVLLLERWNKVHNLTAIKQPEQMITRHLLDSLSISSYVQPGALLDVGAGAGLPGIPLAITRPELFVSLIDSVLKKTLFMHVAASTLGVSNVAVVHQRVEQFTPDGKFSTVTARAFAEVDLLCRRSAHLIEPGGVVLAMVGRPPDHEQMESLGQLTDYRGLQIHKLCVPGEQGERNLVTLRRCE